MPQGRQALHINRKSRVFQGCTIDLQVAVTGVHIGRNLRIGIVRMDLGNLGWRGAPWHSRRE